MIPICELKGPTVSEMRMPERMWSRALDQKPLPPRIRARHHEFRYITNYPLPGRRHLYAEFIEAIRHARKYIYITTPYFVPTRRLARVLRLAAMRNVDVRIIMPEISNHPFVDLAARHSLPRCSPRISAYFYTKEKTSTAKQPLSMETGLQSAL